MDSFTVSANDFVTENDCKISDHYEIQQVLGEGSYGSVRKIRHKVTGEHRAVKILHKNKLNNNATMDAILNEVNLLRKLDHPNILKVFEAYQDKFCYCIVTELCSGGELFEKIGKNRSNEDQAAEYLKQILSCLVYLHDKRIVHRDLKPENFLLQRSQPGSPLKLIDFGSACSFEPGQWLDRRVGTSYYIAPEVLISRQYNEKVDIWSAGVILHILLMGSAPFEGKSDAEILQKIQKTKLDKNSVVYKGLDPNAKDLMFKLLNPDVQQRLTARQALAHQWLRRLQSQQLDRQSSMNLVGNLQSFHPNKNIEKLTLSFITSHLLTSSQLDQMTQLFKSMDLDHNGTLSREEFKEGISKFISLNDVQIDELMHDIDTDNSGEIDYSEFVTACCSREGMKSRDILSIAFKEYDSDGSGIIDREKLKRVVGKHKSMNDGVWDQIINEIDDAGKGSFDFEQFYQALTKDK